MIKYKEQNKYSLNAESYGIDKIRWCEIKEAVIEDNIPSDIVMFAYGFLETYVDGELVLNEDLCKKRIWFLYDILLQEKYNHLYKRDKLVNPKVGDYVYCDYEGFGRGEIIDMMSDNLMAVKFNKRELWTMCSSKDMVTVHDEVKRKITRL